MTKPFIHVVLLSGFPVLFLLTYNQEETAMVTSLLPWLVVVGIGLISWLFLMVIIRNWRRSAFFISLFIMISLSYRQLFSENLSQADQVTGLVIWALVVLGLLGLITISRKPFLLPTKVLNIMALFLVGLNLLFLLTGAWQRHNLYAQSTSGQRVGLQTNQIINTNQPDIYYIILDRYASPKNLKRFYDFDNQSFVSSLENLGFSVAEQTRANYPTTIHSLTSTLNMTYLDSLSETLGDEEISFSPLYRLLEDNEVGKLAKEQGYQYVNIGSWWSGTTNNKNADLNYTLISPSDFTRLIFRTSVFSAIGDQFDLDTGGFFYLLDNPWHYKHALFQFNQLKQISINSEPTFTFAHFLLPHLPYVFSSDGTYLPPEITDQKSNTKNYLDQLKATNTLTLNALETLINNSHTKPIIILQSDEGPIPDKYGNTNIDHSGMRLSEFTDEELDLKTGILNALYLPPELKEQIPTPSSPVNTFRYLFSIIFEMDLPPLPDAYYIYPDKQHPYQFQNVTDRLIRE